MRARSRKGNNAISATASRWLEWLATITNGPRRGMFSRPCTRMPMKRRKNGRTTTTKNRICASLLTASHVEVAHDVDERGRRVAQRVDAVDHAAVTRQERAEVLRAEVAL